MKLLKKASSSNMKSVKAAMNIKNYFRQHLGPNFKNLPCVRLTPSAYRDLVLANDNIFQRAGIQNFSEMDQILISSPTPQNKTFLITFKFENLSELALILNKLQPKSPREKAFCKALLNTYQECLRIRPQNQSK